MIRTAALAPLFAIALAVPPARAFLEIPDTFIPDASEKVREIVADLENNDLARAFKAAGSLASEGDTNALFLVGLCHERGFGADQNSELAERAYRTAAGKGHVAASYALGMLLITTADIVGDRTAEGLIHLTEAANKGLTLAMRQMGKFHTEGRIVTASPKTALEWYGKAAAAGDGSSLFTLGQLAESGYGREAPDKKKALDYYVEAATKEWPPAIVYLALGHETGGLLVKDPEKAVHYLRQAAKLGSGEAAFHLGRLHELGTGVEKNAEEALKQYRTAADLGFVAALNRMATLRLAGLGVTRDEKAAARLYQEASDAGSSEAMYLLSILYRDGKGVGKDMEHSSELLRDAALAGNIDAANALGIRYRRGEGVLRDPLAAAVWFARAADGGLGNAMINLGNMFEGGNVLPRSFGSAGQWYEAAADLGHPLGMFQMARLVESGQGTEKNVVNAYVLYYRSAEAGFAAAEKERDRLKATLTPEQLEKASLFIAKADEATQKADEADGGGEAE